MLLLRNKFETYNLGYREDGETINNGYSFVRLYDQDVLEFTSPCIA